MENYGLENGFRLACMYAMFFSFISAIITFIFLRETLQPRTVAKPDLSVRDTFAGLTKLTRTLPTSLKALIVAYALVAFANGAVGQFYVLYAYSVIRLSIFEWVWVVSAQLLLASTLKIPGGWLSDRVGKKKIMIISLLTCAPTAILFSFSQSLIQTMTVALLLVVTGIYYAPAHEALQADLTPRMARGRITAIWDISNAVSAGLGALIGGFTFQSINPVAPFYIFTLVELAAAMLITGMVKEPTVKEV